MAENPLGGIGGKLKKNKLIVPAALVGGGIGLFFLLKGGGGGGFGGQSPYGTSPEPGGTAGGDSGDFASQLQSLADQVNQSLASVGEQFGSVTSDLQSQITAQQEASNETSQQLGDYLAESVEQIYDAMGQMAGGYASYDPYAYGATPLDYGLGEPNYDYDPFVGNFEEYALEDDTRLAAPSLERTLASGMAAGSRSSGNSLERVLTSGKATDKASGGLERFLAGGVVSQSQVKQSITNVFERDKLSQQMEQAYGRSERGGERSKPPAPAITRVGTTGTATPPRSLPAPPVFKPPSTPITSPPVFKPPPPPKPPPVYRPPKPPPPRTVQSGKARTK